MFDLSINDWVTSGIAGFVVAAFFWLFAIGILALMHLGNQMTDVGMLSPWLWGSALVVWAVIWWAMLLLALDLQGV